ARVARYGQARLENGEVVVATRARRRRTQVTSDRWRLVEDLCHAALERPAEDRAAFLARACTGDGVLQREVESLLAQESRAAGFMSEPAAALAGSAMLDHAKGTLVG